MLGQNGREVAKKIFTPLARALVRLGITPDAVTSVGTVLTVAAALWLFPTGHLLAGVLVVGALVITDALDGTMARLSGRASSFGAFLDSTLDRVSDGAIFGGLTMYFAIRGDMVGTWIGLICTLLGLIVPYARARASALGVMASNGLAERGDRLLIGLAGALLADVFSLPWILKGALILLCLASALTVVQRTARVYHETKNRADQGSGQ